MVKQLTKKIYCDLFIGKNQMDNLVLTFPSNLIAEDGQFEIDVWIKFEKCST